MVSVTKRRVNGTIYYYLSHSYREDNKVKVIEKAIGREIPQDLDSIKEEFIKEIVNKRWTARIAVKRNNYVQKLKALPEVIKANQLREFGVRFTHNTNKIEGSTLTLREVAVAINEPEIPIKKPTKEINEAQCHMIAYEDMINTKLELSMKMVQKWHKILFSLHPERNNFAGLVRKDQIYISGSNYVPLQGGIVCEELLDILFKWYGENKDIINPVLLACLMHFHFVSIHPFLDGNGRMTRLLMNYILFKKEYPMFDIPAEIRFSYYNALEKANLKDDEMIFVSWFFKNYLKSVKEL